MLSKKMTFGDQRSIACSSNFGSNQATALAQTSTRQGNKAIFSEACSSEENIPGVGGAAL